MLGNTKFDFQDFLLQTLVPEPSKDTITFAAAATAVLLRVERQLRFIVCLRARRPLGSPKADSPCEEAQSISQPFRPPEVCEIPQPSQRSATPSPDISVNPKPPRSQYDEWKEFMLCSEADLGSKHGSAASGLCDLDRKSHLSEPWVLSF